MNKNHENPFVPLDFEPSPYDEDPRIKSPDDLISRMSPKKPTPIHVAHDLAELRARYDTDMAQWRAYEQRIQEWRAQVVSIVQGLKRDLIVRNQLAAELERCRTELKAKENELQRLRGAHPDRKVAG